MASVPTHLLRVATALIAFVAPLALAQIEHTVVAGDTLYDLAATYGTSVAAIQSASGLTGSVLSIGQTLVIPVAPPERIYRLHLAEAGEDLAAVAHRFELPLASLMSANPLLSEGVELAGRLVMVPPGAGRTVWVGAGETLLDLAARYGVAPSELAAANGLDAAAVLEADQPLLVPVQGSPVSAAGPVDRAAPSAIGGSDARARHRDQQRALLARASEFADAIERPSEAFVAPLDGRLTSAFGWRNISVGGNRFHGGIDLAADPGTPIGASRDGSVVRAGWVGAYGYAVFLDHGDGSQTRYAHMQRIDVVEGSVVRQGDAVGLVGSTGASTGPHLHFELRFAGRAVDPLLYLESPAP